MGTCLFKAKPLIRFSGYCMEGTNFREFGQNLKKIIQLPHEGFIINLIDKFVKAGSCIGIINDSLF